MREKRKATKEIEEELMSGPFEAEEERIPRKFVSTGSTLLDLCISGGISDEGGIPEGTLIEVHGLPATGKTAILGEIAASAQIRGGDVLFADTEGRFDTEYARKMGIKIDPEKYHRPDTVSELFDLIHSWEPGGEEEATNVILADSLAALISSREEEGEDKRGQQKAKDLHAGVRKTYLRIANEKWILCCSNQLIDGKISRVTPGGHAIPFAASVRIALVRSADGPLVREATVDIPIINDVEEAKHKIRKAYGIKSNCKIVKNTTDDPFRECSIYIIFGHGIDDLRGNLEYLKMVYGRDEYPFTDKKTIKAAIAQVEQNNLEEKIRKHTIEIWKIIEEKVKIERKPKMRI